MIKLLSIYFLSLFLTGCSTEKITKEKLSVIPVDNGYVIHVKDSILKIINDTSNITQLVFNDNEKIELDFFITEPYLSSAYFCKINEMGNVLILESHPVGASGLSANIINVSIIALDKNVSWKVLSYNSFYGGIDLLKYQNEKLILTIYDFNGYINYYDIIYCMTTFEFTKGGFIPTEKTDCFVYTDSGLSNKNDCNCNYLEKTFVFPPY
jgi:hypothetical protein